MHTDQWRNDGYSADALASPLAEGHLAGKHTADTIAQSARLGWMPFYPQFDRNPLDLADEAQAAVDDGRARRPGGIRRRRAAGRQPAARRSRTSTPRRTGRAPWCSGGRTCSARRPRATSTSSSTCSAPTPTCWAARTPPAPRPSEVAWHDEAPEGKLDLLVSADFRMTSTTLLSDVVLPGGDLVREARPVARPTCTRSCTPSPRRSTRRGRRKSDFEHVPPDRPRALRARPRPTSASASDLVSVPLQHDTPGETAQPGGVVRDWRRGDVRAGARARRCRCSQVVERDYTAIADKLATRRPARRLASASPSRTSPTGSRSEVERLAGSNGVMLGGAGDGRPAIDTDVQAGRGDPRASPARPTASWRCRASAPSSSGSASRSPTSPRAVGGEADHLRRHPGRARSR